MLFSEIRKKLNVLFEIFQLDRNRIEFGSESQSNAISADKALAAAALESCRSRNRNVRGSMESRKPPPMEQRFRSLFGLPSDFFDSCRLLSCYSQFPSVALSQSPSNEKHKEEEEEEAAKEKEREEKKANPRWSCNTCKDEFDSLQDQRSHFKSDLHRFNVIPPSLSLFIFLPFYLMY